MIKDSMVTKLGESMERLSKLVSENLGWPVNFFINENNHKEEGRVLSIISDELPENFFGVTAFMIKTLIITSFGNIVCYSRFEGEQDEIVFNLNFTYFHRDNGSNTHAICDVYGKQFHYKYENGSWQRLRLDW